MSAPTAAPSASRYLTPAQRRQITILWERGDTTLSQLASRFGKSERALVAYFAKKGIVKGSKADVLQAAVTATLDNQLVDEVELTAKRIKESKEETYKIGSAIRKLIANTLAKSQTEKRAIGTTANDMKALVTAAQALKIAKEVTDNALGVREDDDDTKDLPELRISEASDESIRQGMLEAGNRVKLDDDVTAILDSLDDGDIEGPDDDSNDVVEVGGADGHKGTPSDALAALADDILGSA